MKKLLFTILIAFFLAGFMPAQETGGVGQGEPQELDLFYALSGDAAEIRAVTPDSVGVPFLAVYVQFSAVFEDIVPVLGGIVPFLAELPAISNIPEKFLRCGIGDGINYERADINTGLIKEALTLRGA